MLVQTAVITLITGIAAGIAPALYETRRLHINPLRTIAASDRVRQRWRHALVVLEITVTVALLVDTAAMIDGYQRARNAQMGIRNPPADERAVDNAAGVPTTQVSRRPAQCARRRGRGRLDNGPLRQHRPAGTDLG